MIKAGFRREDDVKGFAALAGDRCGEPWSSRRVNAIVLPNAG